MEPILSSKFVVARHAKIRGVDIAGELKGQLKRVKKGKQSLDKWWAWSTETFFGRASPSPR